MGDEVWKRGRGTSVVMIIGESMLVGRYPVWLDGLCPLGFILGVREVDYRITSCNTKLCKESMKLMLKCCPRHGVNCKCPSCLEVFGHQLYNVDAELGT